MNVVFSSVGENWRLGSAARLLERRRLLGIGIAAGAAVIGELLHWALGKPLPALSLELAPALSLIAGLFLGLPGVVGIVIGHLLFSLAEGLGVGGALGLGAAHGAVALLACETFRRVPRLGRGLPDLRSYLGLAATAAGASLIAAVAEVAIDPAYPSFSAGNLAAAVITYLTSLLLLVPPALLAADRYLRPWLQPIPGEVPALPLAPAVPPAAISGTAWGQATVIISQERPSLRRGFIHGLEWIAGATAIALLLAAAVPGAESWLALLYLPPVLWAAHSFGLRGGVLAASVAGVAYLLGRGGIGETSGALPAVFAHLILLSLLGALLGSGRQRVTALRGELLDQQQLLRRDLLRVVHALTSAVEAKDSYTEEHLRRVSGYAVAVGERLGLKGKELETLFYGSMLHDIGKIGVPEEVLGKEGPLTPEESEVMRRHPEIGARMVRDLDLLRDVAPLILHHQERWDGAVDDTRFPGYPGGLVGEAIPLGARIIAVVDAFDAMTTDRPYRAGLSPQEATDELCQKSGQQFDPRVVEAFLEVLAEQPWDD